MFLRNVGATHESARRPCSEDRRVFIAVTMSGVIRSIFDVLLSVHGICNSLTRFPLNNGKF